MAGIGSEMLEREGVNKGHVSLCKIIDFLTEALFPLATTTSHTIGSGKSYLTPHPCHETSEEVYPRISLNCFERRWIRFSLWSDFCFFVLVYCLLN